MFRYLGIVGILLLVSGCGALGLADLYVNRSKWESHGFKHYRMELDPECRCGLAFNGNFIVEVREGKIAKAVYTKDNAPVPEPVRKQLPTVEDLFDRIDSGLFDLWREVNPRYHPRYGYPIYTGITTPVMLDVDLNFVVKSFEIVK